MEPVNIIIWVCVLVFTFTSFLTILNLVNIIHIEKEKSKILFYSLIVEIIIVCIGTFKLYMNKDFTKLSLKAEDTFFKPIISVSIEKERFLPKSIIINEEDKTEESRLSDLIIIKDDNKIIKSYEFYHTAKSKSFLNYPFMAILFERLFPTDVKYNITDFNKNGRNEILLKITNKSHGLHHDTLLNFIILNDRGEILITNPYPSNYPSLNITTTNPYSAYKKHAIVDDFSNKLKVNVPFVNEVEIKYINRDVFLIYKWTIDSFSYRAPRVYLIDIYKVNKNYKMEKVNNIPMFEYEDETVINEKKNIFGYYSDIIQLYEYLKINNQLSFYEILNSLKKKEMK